MKIAVVVPFGYENFFHDIKDKDSITISEENQITAKRYNFHINWARSLLNQKLDVNFFFLSSFFDETRTFTHDCGLIMHRIPIDLNKKFFGKQISFQLLKYLKKYNPDVVFCTTYTTPSKYFDMIDILSVFCKLNNYNLISRFSGSDSIRGIFRFSNNLKLHIRKKSDLSIFKSLYYKIKVNKHNFQEYVKYRIKQFSLKNHSGIIPHIYTERKNLIYKYKLDSRKIIDICKPLDLDNFKKLSKENVFRKINKKKNKKYLLHVSGLHDTKGCDLIIELLPQLVSKFPNIELIVIGAGPKKEELLNLTRKLNLESRVTFEGFVNHKDLVYYYNIADLFVLPSQRLADEGEANVLLESIACKTPIISTEIYGNIQLLKNAYKSKYEISKIGKEITFIDGLGALVRIHSKHSLIEAISLVLSSKFDFDNNKSEKIINSYSLEKVGINLKKNLNNIINDVR